MANVTVIYGFIYADDIEGRYAKQGEHFFLKEEEDALTVAKRKFGSVVKKYLHTDIESYESLVRDQAKQAALAKLTEAEKKLLGLL